MLKQIKGAVPCFLAALIWGLSFVAQTTAMDSIETFTFTGVRMMLAVVVLAPIALLSEKLSKAPKKTGEEKRRARRDLLISGTLCGLCLFISINLQQYAFLDTPAGKIGFLTALYMILVPILGTLFFRKKVAPLVWFSVLLATVGIFLICGQSGDLFSFGRGELFSIGCSVFFAVQILISDIYAPRVNVYALSCLQFAVAGGLSLVCMALFETPTWAGIRQSIPELLYVGILSSAGGFTLQLIGQKNTEPVLASMLLCLESVFSTLFGWMLLHPSLSATELLGCGIVFVAILLTLVPPEARDRFLHRFVKSDQKG